jgi:hypothetical protein
MRLATVQAVVKIMAVVDNDGTRLNAASALDVTAPIVSARLGAILPIATYTDFFSYDIPRFRRGFVPVTFRLSTGFVDPVTFVFCEALDHTVLQNVDNVAIVDPSQYVLDAEKGTLMLLLDRQTGFNVLAVTYTAGFVMDEESEVLKGLPDWLSQAGVLSAVRLLQMNPAHFTSRRAPIIKDVQNCLMGEVTQLLNPHIRPRMGLIWPDRSVITSVTL